MSAVGVWINRTAIAEFRKYITLREMREFGSGVQELVDYYQQRGTWEGVEELLAKGVYLDANGMGIVLGKALDDRDQKIQKIPDVLLADVDGRVVYDSQGKAVGKLLSPEEQRMALPIAEAGDEDRNHPREVIGHLLLYFSYTGPLGEWDKEFLDTVEQILLVGAASAVVLIVVVGSLLSRRLSAPLQHLATAARAVAAGDLNQQVEVAGSTEVAQVGQAFNEMTAALQEAETLRQNLVADVAHELRTPISVLQGNLWAILNDAYPLEKAEISRLYDETRLLSRLVEDLRELALADAGQLHPNLRPTDIAQIIRHTVDNFGLAAEVQEVTLNVQLPDDLTLAQADPDRVAQVLRNLLVNALRHTPSGGSVTVSVSYTIRTLEIAIADTGEGIAPENLPHVFERFWRADPARTRSGIGSREQPVRGTGLGLSIAQSLVEAQGGRIWVESTPGEGTVFRFTLPLVQHDD
jgi:two-component system OmpR family sensor kinase/two-component system sensor histidine kinase BaeS